MRSMRQKRGSNNILALTSIVSYRLYKRSIFQGSHWLPWLFYTAMPIHALFSSALFTSLLSWTPISITTGPVLFTLIGDTGPCSHNDAYHNIHHKIMHSLRESPLMISTLSHQPRQD